MALSKCLGAELYTLKPWTPRAVRPGPALAARTLCWGAAQAHCEQGPEGVPRGQRRQQGRVFPAEGLLSQGLEAGVVTRGGGYKKIGKRGCCVREDVQLPKGLVGLTAGGSGCRHLGFQ